MGKLDQKGRDALKMKIHQHLKIHGAENWDELQKTSGVPRSTFFRIVKEVRDEITEGAIAADSPVALQVAQRRVRSIPEPLRKVQDETGRVIPCGPSPRVVASLGDKGRRHLDIMSRYDVLWEDYLMLRRFSVKTSEDGVESVKNPQAFERSMRHGLNITDSQLRAVADVYNMEQIGELYGMIMEEIGKASPEVQHAILVRLRAMNNKLAMTVDAEVA